MTTKLRRQVRKRSGGSLWNGAANALRWALAAALTLGLVLAGSVIADPVLAQNENTLLPELRDGEFILSSDWQILEAGQTDVYRFDYSGDNQPVRVLLNAWPQDGARFDLWTAGAYDLSSVSNVSPFATGAPVEDQLSLFMWEGSGESAESYVVTVGSDRNQTFTYDLRVEGPGVIIEPAVQQPAAEESMEEPMSDGATTEEPAIVAGLPNTEANVRTGPSTDYAVIRSLLTGTPITVLGQDAGGNWLQVRMSDGTVGWIARFLTDFDATTVIESAPVPTPTPVALTPIPVAPTPAPASADDLVPDDAALITIAQPNARANIRTGPSTDFAVMRTVNEGTLVNVLGQNAGGDWLQVQLLDDSVGWVARFLTDYTATAPTVDETPPPTESTRLASTVEAATGVAPLPGQAGRLVDPPVSRELLNDRWRILQDGEVHWHSFQHPGDGTPVQIWMAADPTFGAGFGVYTEGEAQSIRSGADPEDIAAIGRGTDNPDEPGTYFWRGTFEESGRFYVRVRHGTSGPVRYDIFGSGPGFSSP